MNLFLKPLRHLSLWVRQSPFLSRLALRCIPDWHVHVSVPQIGKLRVRLRRNRSLWLRPPLTLEGYPLAVMKTFVRPGDVVWDVGANVGLYARWLVQVLDASKVCSFEPMSENLPELRYNINLGGINNRVQVVPWALSNVDGNVEFQVDDVQSASGALNAVYGGEACRARSAVGLPPKMEVVSSKTIDSILGAGDLPAPNVLKIDVEGAERMLLDGGADFFSTAAPRIMIETHGAEVARQCLSFLFERNYHVAALVPESWKRSRHMRLTPDSVERVVNEYDAHFIMASKHPDDIPDELDWGSL